MNTRHCHMSKAELAARVQGQLRTLERQAVQLKKQAKCLLMSMTVAEIGEYAKRITTDDLTHPKLTKELYDTIAEGREKHKPTQPQTNIPARRSRGREQGSRQT